MSNSGEKMPAPGKGDDETIGDGSILLKDPSQNVEIIGKRKDLDSGVNNSDGEPKSNKKGKSSTIVKSFFNLNTLFETGHTYFKTVTRILNNFKTHYNVFNREYNKIINDTRNALTGAAKVAKEFAIPMINMYREQGLVRLSNAYDGYLTATGLVEDVKEGLGFQTIDTIILEHEKMACIALLELVYAKQGIFINGTTTNIGYLITQAMEPDENYRDKQEQVRTHIEMAVKVYFIFKHGKSAVEDMSIIASKGINYGDLKVPDRSTRELQEQYLIDSRNDIINNILNDQDERNVFLINVVNNILPDPNNPIIDHSKYYGKSVTADSFIRNKFSDIRIPIDSLKTQYNFYITGRANTGNSIGKIYIPRLNRIQLELDAIMEDLKNQKLTFPGTTTEEINKKITKQSGDLQTEIIKLQENMDKGLPSSEGEKEEGGGKKTRRRKATSSRRVSLRKRKSKRDKRSNQSKGTLKKKHSKKHKA